MVRSKWNGIDSIGYRFEKDENPYPLDAPWPSMRHDTRNSGARADLSWKPLDGSTNEIRHFQTDNAIFSTPVIGADDKIYVGSSDKRFYAIDPNEGKILWSRELGGIIDSAACIGKDGTVYVPAGDGQVHAYNPDGSERWHYDALHGRPKYQFSFSSNFWFEGNIALGPDGALYAGNDDFFLYKIAPDTGNVIWGYRTGFFIWSTAVFDDKGTVFISSFDHLLYAIDSTTSKKKWSLNLHGGCVASPAIGSDSTIYQASFNNNIYAIDVARGKIKWTFATGGHIYASPAIALGGDTNDTIYIGSTNGNFFAIDASTGNPRWTFYIGDTIRASASIGPDPEALATYLVYLGGGDGRVYAIDPDGNLRWSYDTLVKTREIDYPNINASIALGRSGIAVASSTGDIIWIPYDAYLNDGIEGIQRSNLLLSSESGPFWHNITSGGKLAIKPILHDAQKILPVNTISLRLLVHDSKGTTPGHIVPGSVRISAQPEFKHRFEIQSDPSILNIVPEEILVPGTRYTISLSIKYKFAGEETFDYDANLLFMTAEYSTDAPELVPGSGVFKIMHMAIPQPNIIPSLNQIGFASLVIPFTIIDSDENHARFIAWAVQKFGDEGVPQKRVSVYAFTGRRDGDHFMMDSHKCLFEITAFNLPLELFRIAGMLGPGGTADHGGSLIVEKHWGSNLQLLGEIGSTSPVTTKIMLTHLKTVGLVEFLRALRPFYAALVRQFSRNTWTTWGLINHRDHLMGIGTFKIEPAESESAEFLKDIQVLAFDIDKKRHKIIAEVVGVPKIGAWDPVVRIILADVAMMEVLPINYSKYNVQTTKAGKIRVIFSIKKNMLKGHEKVRAYLLVSLYLLKTIDF